MHRKILRGLLVALPAWAAAFGAPVRFEANLAEEAGSGEATVVLRLLPQTDGGTPRTVTLPVPGEVLVDLPEETTWQVLTESRTLWSAPQWVAPSPGGDEKLVRLRLHPAATVAGVLEVPTLEPLPSRLDLRLESFPDARSPKIPLTPVDCPVEEKRFVCRVPAGRLDLRLRAANRIPAYLWDLVVQAGEVAGARVEALGELSEAGAGSGDQTVTGPAGELTLKLPVGTRMISLSVLAPGHATRMMLVPLGAEQVLEIPVEPVGGTLVFDFGTRTVQEVMASRTGILSHGGAFVPFGVTRWWVQMGRIPQPDPHRLVLPNMEAGEYVLCFGAAQEAVARGHEPPQGQCSRGYLAPLQELVLRVPEIP